MNTSQAAEIELRLEQRSQGNCIARIIIHNESRLNVLNSKLMDELVKVFHELEPQENLCAAVLTGAGEKAFVGGADIDEMAALEPPQAKAFITRLHSVCQAIRDLPAPVIARIQGYALGGGMEVAASCDLRLAGKSARFGMPEVRLGIPSVIEAALLPRLVGWGWARRLLLLGDMISAEDALACGFLERVVADSELDAAVDEWLEMLLSSGPKVLRQQKALITNWQDVTITEAIDMGIKAFRTAYEGGEPQQKMRAFLNKKQQTRTKLG